MAEGDSYDFHDKLYLLQKRLKNERLFIRQDKELISKLNEDVLDSCNRVYHLAWTTRQHWRNLDRLISGTRVFPADCSKTAIDIEGSRFEDASKHLGYQDLKYGEFLLNLRRNPTLVANVLSCANMKGVDISNISRLLLMCLYGSCLIKEDENYVLRLLNNLMTEQLIPCDDIKEYFFGPKSSSNGFLVVLRQYSELLFSSKLYLTAALHGTVMQIIVDDSLYLDLDINKVLNRLSPIVIREKFGDPGTPKNNRKMTEHLEMLYKCLVNICNKFIRSLKDKIYCFPTGIKWILRELFTLIKNKTNDDVKKTTAIVGHVLINFFICPAIVNPEPYGINSDAFISEAARYNLSQVAGILRSLALAACEMRDIKMDKILHLFDEKLIQSYVEAVLQDADQLDPFNEKGPVKGLHPSAALMTEIELKTLIYFMKRIQREDKQSLKSNGIDALLNFLPPLPRRWTKPNLSLERNATSLPIAMQLKANPDLIHPSPVQRNGKSSKTLSLYSPKSLDSNILEKMGDLTDDQNLEGNQNDKEEYDVILADLSSMIKEDDVVLVISYGYDEDNKPGTLHEEKILGLKHDPFQNTTFDIDATEEEKQRRASTIIQDAMKEEIKSIEPVDESTSFQESESFNDKTFDETNISSTVFSTPDSTPKTSHVLIDFDAEEKIADKDDEEKATVVFNDPWVSTKPNSSLIDFDGPVTSQVVTTTETATDAVVASFTDLDVPSSTSGFSETTNSSAAFFKNKSATIGPIKNSPSVSQASSTTASLGRSNESNLTNQITTGSLLGSLNTILQKPTAPSPSSFTTTFQFEDDFVKLEANKNRLSLQESVITEEEFADETKSSESNIAAEASSFDNLKITKDVPRTPSPTPLSAEEKEEAMKQLKKEIADNEKKESRKSWLKDKLASGKGKLKSVKSDLKNRTKSDGQHTRKIQEQKAYRKMTSPSIGMKQNIEEQNTPTQSPLKSSQEISDEIIAKYRNLSSNHGLMQDISHGDMAGLPDFPKETEFDDDFKFEDAKRKLRIVLCISDRSNFPSGASNCSQLLMTFLQAQLAEAINLQDRSVVAQLHETLRSIKQLPNGSCEKLLDALEEDYKKRSSYVSYLARSKQGLLATISHLEQVRRKVERDKAICSKYFTTICVRLFLETPDKRREIAQFAHKFEATKMVDEKCALLEEFLEKLYSEMNKDPTWVAAPEENWQDAKIATERTILSKIYKAAFYPNGKQDIENDKIFHEHITRLSKTISVNHTELQIRKVFQKEAPWPSAQTELLMINAYKTPVDKLRCVHRCCITIMNLLSMATPSQTSGADEFVPVLVYVLIRANAPNLLSTKQYIHNFYGNRLSGEESYCWTQFSAAVEFVKSLDDRGGQNA
eukprot:gene15998-17609_t